MSWGTTLGGGGTIAVKGALDLAQSQATTEVALDALNPGAAGIRAVGSGGHCHVRQADRARQRPDSLRHRQVQRACGASRYLVRQVRVARSARERGSNRMEQAERLDRAGRPRDAPGDGHRSAFRRTACVRAARAQRPVEPRLADARGRSPAATSAAAVAPRRGRAAARRHEKKPATREERVAAERERRRRGARAAPPSAPAPPSMNGATRSHRWRLKRLKFASRTT